MLDWTREDATYIATWNDRNYVLAHDGGWVLRELVHGTARLVARLHGPAEPPPFADATIWIYGDPDPAALLDEPRLTRD